MSDFHVRPSDLDIRGIEDAAEDLKKIVDENAGADVDVFVRGQNISGEYHFQQAGRAPADHCDGATDYLWTYCSAKEWLRQYEEAKKAS